jgi:hypothetical protein
VFFCKDKRSSTQEKSKENWKPLGSESSAYKVMRWLKSIDPVHILLEKDENELATIVHQDDVAASSCIS